jgi:hypothetical protein
MPIVPDDPELAALQDRLRQDPGRCPRCSSTQLVHVRGSLASGGDVQCTACRCRWSLVWSNRKAVAALAVAVLVVGYAATQVVLNLRADPSSPETESSVRTYGVMLAAALFFSVPFVLTAFRVLAGRARPQVQEWGEK